MDEREKYGTGEKKLLISCFKWIGSKGYGAKG